MISTNDFHTGLTFEMDGDIYEVVEFQHVKPARERPLSAQKLKIYAAAR